MDQELPITFENVLNLTSPNIGINQKIIQFNTTTLQSEKYACIRNTISPVNTVCIVDLKLKKTSINKITADSTIMNPNSKVIALRSGTKVQIYNLDMQTLMKEYTFPDNTDIEFWKWISPSVIAIITKTTVFHWSMDSSSIPKKIFERNSKLDNSRIINYKTDKNLKWFLITAFIALPNQPPTGLLQLFSLDKGITQVINGHVGDFVEFKMGSHQKTLICFANSNDKKIFFWEVPSGKPGPKFQQQQKQFELQSPVDFPIVCETSDKYGVFYIITKAGFLYVYDVETGSLIYQNRITNETVFVSTRHTEREGILGLTKSGKLLSVSINEKNIISYITNNLQNREVAISMASRANLSGADDLYIKQFNALLQTNQIDKAIKLACQSPKGILRTLDTLRRLQRMQIQTPNGPIIPISQYFKYIIDNDKLNIVESTALSHILIKKPNGLATIKAYVDEGKMEPSEQLGDIVAQVDQQQALQIYFRAKAHEKIINSFISKGDYNNVINYCTKFNYKPNYMDVFKKILSVNAKSSAEFASKIYSNDKDNINPHEVVNYFISVQCYREATSFMLDIMKEDKKEDAELQTKLIEMNLVYSPISVANNILKEKLFSHFDKYKIAKMCEQAGLYARALENFTEMTDIKRVIVYTHSFDLNWLLEYFKKFQPEEVLECLNEMMKHNTSNLSTIVAVASNPAYSQVLSPQKLIELFEHFHSVEGLFYYLNSIVDSVKDPEVHFKYIQASVGMKNFSEVERITRESDFYDPEKTKKFLMNVKLADMTPLINVCDKNGFVEEMVGYLYNNQQLKYINIYVKQINPKNTPKVVGSLLDVNASEEFIKNLILSVGQLCPIEDLISEVEKRNRLKLLIQFLEARLSENNKTVALHNALAKIYIDLNKNAESFLNENNYYDKKVIGNYCEKRNPHFAFICYKKGECDDELIELTNNNAMYKLQARYLVKRQDLGLWAKVLTVENKYKRQIIDQVVQTALPESKDPEEVKKTVKAFMDSKLPNELIELLEQIVIKGDSEFKENTNLQDLLILTAFRANKSKVMEYIKTLNDYSVEDIARIAIETKLYEEAFTVFQKAKLYKNSIEILIKHIGSIERATVIAEEVNQEECWSLLGQAQLTDGMVPEAIESFMKANDPSKYHEVITVSEKTKHFSELIVFLKMARNKIRDSHIDTELIYSFAHNDEDSNSLADLEEFISQPNTAKIQYVGDRCFDEGLYEAARILFENISNHSRLASALVKLGKHREAVAAATHADSLKTWKEVMAACVDAGDFKYAQACGLNIILNADELDDLIHYYEVRGHHEEVILLLEKGAATDGATVGVFTNLGILYAKYKPEKMMDHINKYYGKSNIPKLLNSCEDNELWAEMRTLFMYNDQFDAAVKCMIDHSVEAWDHNEFVEAISKSVNEDLYYKSIHFYLSEKPQHIIDLLNNIAGKVDHSKVAKEVKSANSLPLIKEYLENNQNNDLKEVNESLNSLYIDEEDFESLRISTEKYHNFDQLSLAKQLQDHELLEFRRIASSLFKYKKQWKQSIDLSKKDKLYKDAMETASYSNNKEVAENLLKFFCKNELKECFSACLYNCYNLIRPDFALEMAWKNKYMDMCMPYLIQVVHEYTKKIDDLQEKEEERKEKEEEEEKMRKSQMEQYNQMVDVSNVGVSNFYPPNMNMPVTNDMQQSFVQNQQSNFYPNQTPF